MKYSEMSELASTIKDVIDSREAPQAVVLTHEGFQMHDVDSQWWDRYHKKYFDCTVGVYDNFVTYEQLMEDLAFFHGKEK